ncbi:MAG: sarcosine oxidase subunit gamma SoxG [Deltaproteobacteria bacterium]|nr:sarcosine oxidase subunit gamma SoxG [Deltaproteobacteria bacterium]
MIDMERLSPVIFPREAMQVETQNHWRVIMEYESEGPGPWVIDLSHRPRWDVQGSRLSDIKPLGLDIPETPGQCRFEKGALVNRMNRTQASVWQIAGASAEMPAETAFTETTDATLFLALVGREVFSIAEKLSAIDFLDPSLAAPALIQAPFSHVPCQIVLAEKAGNMPGILLTCSRGYAGDMVAAIMHAGREFSLKPAGSNAFENWVDTTLQP